MPINDASKCYLVPEWLAKARQPEVRQWAVDKYAHVPRTEGPDASSPRYKFPRERKPALGEVMRDVAILLLAAWMLGEPIFVWVEDAALPISSGKEGGRCTS